mgnify:CR=1 FL=1
MTSSAFSFDDTDLFLYSSDLDLDLDDNLETMQLTDEDIRDILTLPSLSEDPPTQPEKEKEAMLNTPPPTSLLELALNGTISRSPSPLEMPAPEQQPNPTQPDQPPQSDQTIDSQMTEMPKLYLAQVIKPPSLLEVKLFCRQEVIMLSGLLFLGSLTTPFIPGCFQTAHIWDHILDQTYKHLKKIKPFNKLHQFYRLTIDHPIFTFLAQDSTPYSLTKKHLTAKRNPTVPRPLYTMNENLIVTLTFTMDIVPYGSNTPKDMFGPTSNKPSILNRLGPKRPRTPESPSSVEILEAPLPKKKRQFFAKRKSPQIKH